MDKVPPPGEQLATASSVVTSPTVEPELKVEISKDGPPDDFKIDRQPSMRTSSASVGSSDMFARWTGGIALVISLISLISLMSVYYDRRADQAAVMAAWNEWTADLKKSLPVIRRAVEKLTMELQSMDRSLADTALTKDVRHCLENNRESIRLQLESMKVLEAKESRGFGDALMGPVDTSVAEIQLSRSRHENVFFSMYEAAANRRGDAEYLISSCLRGDEPVLHRATDQ